MFTFRNDTAVRVWLALIILSVLMVATTRVSAEGLGSRGVAMLDTRGLTRLSAIRFDGTNYVDLGVLLYKDSSVEIDFTSDPTGKNLGVFGTRIQYDTAEFCLLTNYERYLPGLINSVRYDYAWSNTETNKSIYGPKYNKGERVRLKKTGPLNYAYNETTKQYDQLDSNDLNSAFEVSRKTAYLGAINQADAPVLAFKGLVHSMKLSRGGDPIFYLVPVMKDGKGYFLNRLDGTLFGSKPTGTGFPKEACVE